MWTLIIPLMFGDYAAPYSDSNRYERQEYRIEVSSREECHALRQRLLRELSPYWHVPHIDREYWDHDQPPGVDRRWSYVSPTAIGYCDQTEQRPDVG